MKRKKIVRLAFAVAAAAVFIAGTPLRAAEIDDSIGPMFKQTYVYKAYLQDDAINIDVKDGVVTLTGTVDEEFHKTLAEETVASLPGVVRVDNQLATRAEVGRRKRGRVDRAKSETRPDVPSERQRQQNPSRGAGWGRDAERRSRQRWPRRI